VGRRTKDSWRSDLEYARVFGAVCTLTRNSLSPTNILPQEEIQVRY